MPVCLSGWFLLSAASSFKTSLYNMNRKKNYTHGKPTNTDAKTGRQKPDGVSPFGANIKLTYCCSLCGIKEITGEDVLASK